ncbi:MAG: F-type H+-transporting ATPase subunit delta [Paracoccaceae bacterium]
MSETASISLGVAARYATAVFDLAQEGKKLAAIENDVNALAAALESSDDFSDLISSPVYSRAEQAGAIAAIAKKMGLNGITTNTLGLMAENRRLFVLPHLVTAIRDLIAEEKGEVTAEITSAKN